MPKLINYATLSTKDNSRFFGNLVRAQCSFCGLKYSSIEEARSCEEKHIKEAIIKFREEFKSDVV